MTQDMQDARKRTDAALKELQETLKIILEAIEHKDVFLVLWLGRIIPEKLNEVAISSATIANAALKEVT